MNGIVQNPQILSGILLWASALHFICLDQIGGWVTYQIRDTSMRQCLLFWVGGWWWVGGLRCCFSVSKVRKTITTSYPQSPQSFEFLAMSRGKVLESVTEGRKSLISAVLVFHWMERKMSGWYFVLLKIFISLNIYFSNERISAILRLY